MNKFFKKYYLIQFENGGRGPGDKQCRQFFEAGESNKTDFVVENTDRSTEPLPFWF